MTVRKLGFHLGYSGNGLGGFGALVGRRFASIQRHGDKEDEYGTQ
jgi:hypothetical protein